MYKVMLYCQIGGALDLAKFSIKSAIENAGLEFKKDFNIIFICWKTSEEVFIWLKENNYQYKDIGYDEGKGFIWNLYRGWNAGYPLCYEKADLCVPIATDHYFGKNWLKNMINWAKPNRIINCKLIEPGTQPSLHTCINLGFTAEEQFNYKLFDQIYKIYYKDELITDENEYGHRLDAMPFCCPKDVWERFGPMSQIVQDGWLTGDTDFFNRCKDGGVEITKALNSISYHAGGMTGGETERNKKAGIYS